MDNKADKDTLLEALLLERDELYQELSKLRQADKGALAKAEKEIAHYKEVVEEKDRLIRKLTDQLAWFRRKFWKSSSEKYIPSDPAQRKIDFNGLEILPEEEAVISEVSREIISYKRKNPENDKKQPVRLPLPEDLRREVEVIEPEGIDENWIRIGEEITEQLENKPGEVYVRRIIRPKYALKKDLQLQQETGTDESLNKVVKIAPLPLLPLPRSN
ncbi:MAG: IS66 family transposase, partial [Bacteroidales bacterium]|nr:IS66 family transposase [Bacteroidales bacterium]